MGPRVESCLGALEPHVWFVPCSFPVFVCCHVFGVSIWTPGVPETSIWSEMGCKQQLCTSVGILFISVACFLRSWVVLGTVLMSVGALEAGLKLDDFAWLPQRAPDPKHPPRGSLLIP